MTRFASGGDAVAVTSHHLATEAALGVMESGGNAVDAAVAANAVLGVVAPETCGVGGDLFALVWQPGMAQPLCLNASGRAGSGANGAGLRAAGHSTVPYHSPQAVTVPGCVDGWEAMIARVGSRALADLLAPARALCTGFEVSLELAGALARSRDWLEATPAAASLYPGGQPAPAGAIVARPRLAETLAVLAERGRAGFFAHIGPGLLTATAGAVTSDDCARTQAQWVDPIGIEIAGRHGWTAPPNSQGYLALASLYVAARVIAQDHGDDVAYHHALVEAYRASAAERDAVVADPARAPLPPSALLDPVELERRAGAVTADAGTWPLPPRAAGGTSYLCTVDAAGMGVSLIQSNFTGFGGGLSAGDTGVFLHNRGAGFTLAPGHVNELGPGRRPLHTLSPTLWTAGDSLAMLLGTRGGHQQPQLLCQVGGHLLVAGEDLERAQERPRWVLDHFGPGKPSAVRVEHRMPPSVVDGLRERGHRVVVQEADWQEGWGPVSVISVTGATRSGAADPRVSTSAAAAA